MAMTAVIVTATFEIMGAQKRLLSVPSFRDGGINPYRSLGADS